MPKSSAQFLASCHLPEPRVEFYGVLPDAPRREANNEKMRMFVIADALIDALDTVP